jgi:hypothetical protein
LFRNSIETIRSRAGGDSDSVRNELFDEKELKFVSIPTCILHQFSPVFFHHLAEIWQKKPGSQLCRKQGRIPSTRQL